MAKYRIDGFEQIKAFYCWVFNNPDKVRPTHISLYLFLWNQGNRAHWVEWFKCPYDLAMQGACIGNNGTYYRCLDDLKKFGLMDYKKGVNNFKAPLINLFKLYDSEHVDVPLPEQQYVQQPEQQYVQQYVQQPEQQYVHIYKLITNNLEQITNNFDKVEKFILSLSETTKPEKFILVSQEKIFDLVNSLNENKKIEFEALKMNKGYKDYDFAEFFNKMVGQSYTNYTHVLNAFLASKKIQNNFGKQEKPKTRAEIEYNELNNDDDIVIFR